MKKSVVCALLLLISLNVQAGTFYDSVINCSSAESASSRLNIHVEATDLYKKDRIKGSIEFADFAFVLSRNKDMCQYQYLKISLQQFKNLIGRDKVQFSFPMSLDCFGSAGNYTLNGYITLDSSHKAASIVYSEGEQLKQLQMKCESKSLFDRVADAIVPEFGS